MQALGRFIRLASFGIVAVLPLLAACSKKPTPATSAITGTLRHQTVTRLPANATLSLQLTDVTGVDGAAVALAQVDVKDIAALPYDYTLPFDPTRINGSLRYTVEARIRVDGQLLYATDTPFAVLTEGHDRHADLTLITAGDAATSSAVTAPPEDIFQGQLPGAAGVTPYSAGIKQDKLLWIEAAQARYEFNGGYLLHYRDSKVEIEFDDHGKPLHVRRGQQSVPLNQAQALISTARTRAALLRSHALATRETRQHRIETEQLGAAAMH